MKAIKFLMVALVAIFTVGAVSSCDDDDVANAITNATQSGQFKIEFSVNPGVSDSTTLAQIDQAFGTEITAIKNFSKTTDKSYNQALAITLFEATTKTADSSITSMLSKAAAKGYDKMTVTATLTNVTTAAVVDTKTWTATSAQ